jgi:hypothetical protein
MDLAIAIVIGYNTEILYERAPKPTRLVDSEQLDIGICSKITRLD